MICNMVTITIQKKFGRGIFHFGFPLWFVWILLVPLAILTLPVVLLISLVRLTDPCRVISIFWGILRALKGTEVEIDDRSHLAAIRIRQEEI